MLKCFTYLIFFLTLLSFNLQAQKHGKLYSKIEADVLYGPVITSNVITAAQLSVLCEGRDILMFRMMGNQYAILGAHREYLLSTELVTYSETDIFTVFSTSVILELLKTGGADNTYIEKRESVLSITNGSTTLEFGTFCPPFCE